MKTRDWILTTSLHLFNELGEPNVTTNHIADEMDISPGNLHYHFRKKEDIVIELFKIFETDIFTVLQSPRERTPDFEDMWLYLHLTFEKIWKYRFFYRDLNHLINRYKKLQTGLGRILERKVNVAATLCRGMVEEGAMHASEEEINALANNIALTATYWLSYDAVRHRVSTFWLEQEVGNSLSHAVYQVLILLMPYQDEATRAYFTDLATRYLNRARSGSIKR